MAMIQWDSRLSVNVAEIDRQHQKLVAMINDLNDAMRQGKGKDLLDKIVARMLDYTTTHFATEEMYFARFGYPETEIHKREHQAFIKKVLEFKHGFESGRVGLSVDVMDFLSDWLKNHIMGSDKKYSSFFNQKGLV